ncbi:TIP41-like protein [Sarcoptes scabiei]|nr:TIP41-like protein [Sarcoptes scabiei]
MFFSFRITLMLVKLNLKRNFHRSSKLFVNDQYVPGFKNTKTDGFFYWNDVLFSSTFNEIVRVDRCRTNSIQKSLFREKNFIKCFDKGFFTLMPFVTRAIHRLMELIQIEMFKINAHQIMMPSLVGKHLWTSSGRWDYSGDEIFRLKDRHDNEFCLAPTHEEVITRILASCHQISHRQLPVYLYQISPKYRDELRTKQGLLRAREFIMKDLYTFDIDEEHANQTYELVCSTYDAIFRSLELPVTKTVGSVGSIGGKHSHEFLLESDLGEDEFYTCFDCFESFNIELLDGSSSFYCLNCKSQKLSTRRKAIELGHSFLLNDRYSRKMNAFYSEESSKEKKFLQMGCYGLGVSRIVATSVEYLSAKLPQNSSRSKRDQSSAQHSSETDLFFLRWPKLLVPFKICLIIPKQGSKEDIGKGTEFSMHLAKVLHERFNEDILIDNRSNMTIGKRMLTAQAIGIPFIIIAGRNITDSQPKFELFAHLDNENCSHNSFPLSTLYTQAELLDYLKIHLKPYSL